MANIKSAIKRIKQSEKKRVRNRVHRSRARTFVKQARKAIQSGDMQEAQAAAERAVQFLDRAAQKGVIHPNNAARRKSRLMKSLQSMQNTSQ